MKALIQFIKSNMANTINVCIQVSCCVVNSTNGAKLENYFKEQCEQITRIRCMFKRYKMYSIHHVQSGLLVTHNPLV